MSAQFVSFGVKTGAVLNDAIPQQAPFSAASDARLTAGPTVEFHFWDRLSLEVDVLFRAYSQTTQYPIPAFISTGAGTQSSFGGALAVTQTHTKAQEFPVLLKYRFTNGLIRPFVTAGASISRQSDTTQSALTCLGTATSCVSTGGTSKSTSYQAGPAAGAGVDFKAGRIHIEPEVRYTRASNPTTNRITAMIGFRFGK